MFKSKIPSLLLKHVSLPTRGAGTLRNMSFAIPKILDHEINVKELMNEPSTFDQIHSGKKWHNGFIYMIKCGNSIEIPTKEDFNIENRGFVLLSETTRADNHEARAIPRNELPFNDLEHLRSDTSFHEVFLEMNYNVGFRLDLLAFNTYQSSNAEIDSIQVFYFDENSKEGIIQSIEKYKEEIKQSDKDNVNGFIPRDYVYSQGYPNEFIELLNRVQYYRVSTFYQLPIPQSYVKREKRIRIQLIIVVLCLIIYLFQIKKALNSPRE